MTNWYINNTINSSGNGSSWLNAWKSFSNIIWDSVNSGDTIYISGGTISKTYNETLQIKKSGTVTNRITISVGQDVGHDGTVIITSTSGVVSGVGLYITNQSNIIVTGKVGSGTTQNIRITNGSWHGIDIEGILSNIKLENIEISNNGSSADNHGIYIWTSNASNGIEISHCYIHDNYQDGIKWGESIMSNGFGNNSIHHCTITNTHDDGIEMGASSVDFHHNIQGNNIAPERGHPDGIQAYGQYYRIFNNYFHGFRDQSGNAVIYIEPDGNNPGFSPFGHIHIYNNLFYEDKLGSWANGAICIAISGDSFEIVNDIKILNNTIVGHDIALLLAFNGILLKGSEVSDYYVENNIIYNGQIWYDVGGISSNLITYGNHGESASVIVDYNDLYNTGYTENNIHGILSNPNLDNNQRPQSTSPVIDKAFNWSGLFTTDKDDKTRSLVWDMGAYEYTTQECPTPTVSFTLEIL